MVVTQNAFHSVDRKDRDQSEGLGEKEGSDIVGIPEFGWQGAYLANT
jgi:hypothetical protein